MSVFECQSILIFYSNRSSLKRTQDSWEPEMVISCGGGGGGWGIGCPGGEVTLTSQLPVSVRFGSGGMEWVGGTISGLHQEKPGKAACCFHQETC